MQYAAQNLIPSTTELGGKSPNIFFDDVMAADDAFLDKAIEGLVLYAFNKGEVCTCPSRALIQESIYDEFMERCLERIAAIRQGDPLDPATMIGAAGLESPAREDRGLRADRPRRGRRGADRRRTAPSSAASSPAATTSSRPCFKGDNDMRVFQEEIFGPVLAVTTFKDEAEALEIANDTMYGLGAGVWTRDGSRAFRMGRAIKAGRVWTNCYHQYPAHAAFGGYKASGVGRENHQHDARPLLADQVPAGQLRPRSRSGSSEMPEVAARDRATDAGARGDRAPHGRARPARASSSRGAAATAAPRSACAPASCRRRRTTSCSASSAATPVYIDADQDERWSRPELRHSTSPRGRRTGSRSRASTESTSSPAREQNSRVGGHEAGGVGLAEEQSLGREELRSPAVPCWSSWKTGMSSESRSRRSISKQRGAAMSSRLMPPNTGAIASTTRTISSVSLVDRQIGNASTRRTP